MKFVFTFLSLVSLISCNSNEKQHEAWFREDETEKIEQACKVEVFSEQFKWTIRYSGQDNVLGKFDYKLTSDENPLALMTAESIDAKLLENDEELQKMEEMSLHMEITQEFIAKQQNLQKIQRLLKQMQAKHDTRLDASAQDDLIITDTMILCVEKAYELHFRSKDVIHSAYFPHFRVQTKTVPGMTTRLNFTSNETTKKRKEKLKDDSFEFMLMCNKICGKDHYTMKMVVRVVEEEEYTKWLSSQGKNLFKNRVKA